MRSKVYFCATVRNVKKKTNNWDVVHLIPDPQIANYWAKYWFDYSAGENVF